MKYESEIMCTLTVDQIMNDMEVVRSMYDAGMRSVRINTAHLDGPEQLGELAEKLKSTLPAIRILIDTKGPEVRTTAIGRVRDLEVGDTLCIEGVDDDRESRDSRVFVNYPKIHNEVTPDDIILIDDGHIRLRVDAVIGTEIRTHVIEPGMLGSRKGVSVLGKDLNLPAVSMRDKAYIRYAAKADTVDVIAHSFVRCAADVLAVKDAMDESQKPLIAKIENQQGIDNLEEIIDVADGILIARGDLTACIGKEAVPEAQNLIARLTKTIGKPLYLATNILPSLMSETQVSAEDEAGIKLAISQGVDVMLLTNETASGANPVLSVNVLSKTIKDCEKCRRTK